MTGSTVYAPHNYQTRGTEFIVANRKCAAILDMGLGKTVMVLTAVRQLLDSFAIRGVIVVAPLHVATETWPDEIRKWRHTRSLVTRIVHGTEAQRVAALAPGADVYLINYENLGWLAARLASGVVWPFDMIVFDESCKMKSHSAQRFKLFKVAAAQFERSVIMSGTPATESYFELWAQYYLLDSGARLLPFFTHFRERYGVQVSRRDFFKWRLRDGAAKQIEDKVRDLTFCLTSEDYIEMPPLIFNTVKVKLPPTARKHYDELETEMLTQLEGKDIAALNAASVSGKCRQLLSGAVYTEDEVAGKERPFATVHTAKLDALAGIVDGANGQSVLVVYQYKHELKRLLRKWPGTPWIAGGSKNAKQCIIDWNRQKTRLMFVHPASVAHGINLQAGGHIMAFLTSPWSGRLRLQMVKRLHRQGQPHPVIIHDIIVPGTVDTVVMRSLGRKDQTQAAFIRALKTLG